MRGNTTMPKLHTRVFGCQMSSADADEMAGAFLSRGFALTPDLDDADAVLVGTCTVREHAEHRALSYIGRLRDWKKAHPSGALIVAGCAAERLGPELRRRFPHVDLVAGARSIDDFPRLAAEALAARFDWFRETGEAFPGSGAGGRAPAGVSAFVTVMRGCNHACSYCIVPSVRGAERYRPAAEVLDEVRRRVSEGAREIVLLGQTVNSYRSALGGRAVAFPDLLALADAVPGLRRLRFMSPHPGHLDEATARAMAALPRVCPSLHLPAQSGSDRILKLMRRATTRREFLDKAAMAAAIVPGLALTTDILVGFPTETPDDFEASLSLLREMGAASAYCFKYSPRESTQAAGLPDDVPREVKEERLGRLLEEAALVNGRRLDALRGGRAEVLAEEPGAGRTREGFWIKLDVPVAPGETVEARILGRTRQTLIGAVEPDAAATRRHA